jgi:ribosomal-protein-alanine N-acetyltransferase
MITEDVAGKRIVLTTMASRFVTEEYLNWMVNPEVTQYLESRFLSPTISELEKFVESMRVSDDNYFFAIVDRASEKHIGNIKLGPVDRHHETGVVGIMLGDSSSWGKGFATEAISLLTSWSFSTLNLVKLTAGSYASNLGSIRAFEKSGWGAEGRQISQVRLAGGTRDAVVTLGVVNPRAR